MVMNKDDNVKAACRLCEKGAWQEVLTFAQEWHLENPTDATALYYIGIGYSGLKQFRKAEAAYRRALSIDPVAVKVWTNLACILFEHMKCESEGIRCMEQSLKIDPNHKIGWSNLATMAGQTGDMDKVMFCADKALALDPEFIEAHLHKGRAALALGKTEVVKEVCLTLSGIKPENFCRSR